MNSTPALGGFDRVGKLLLCLVLNWYRGRVVVLLIRVEYHFILLIRLHTSSGIQPTAILVLGGSLSEQIRVTSNLHIIEHVVCFFSVYVYHVLIFA